MACLPPSTARLTPVENEASSLARNAMALATSSGSIKKVREIKVTKYFMHYMNYLLVYQGRGFLYFSEETEGKKDSIIT